MELSEHLRKCRISEAPQTFASLHVENQLFRGCTQECYVQNVTFLTCNWNSTNCWSPLLKTSVCFCNHFHVQLARQDLGRARISQGLHRAFPQQHESSASLQKQYWLLLAFWYRTEARMPLPNRWGVGAESLWNLATELQLNSLRPPLKKRTEKMKKISEKMKHNRKDGRV